MIMNKEEFDRALKCQDFAIGDTFWLDNVEFEVKRKIDRVKINVEIPFETLEDYIKNNFKPSDFWNISLKEAVRKVELGSNFLITKTDLFEILHDRWEINNCDYCGVLEPTRELIWNELGATCMDCFNKLSENKKLKYRSEYE